MFMRRLSYLAIAIITLGGAILAAFSPDTLSLAMTGLMCLIVGLGIFFGVLPVISYTNGLVYADQNILRTLDIQSSSSWVAIRQMDSFFHQPVLDRLFGEYTEKVRQQRESGQVMSDIEDYINEDILGLQSWQNVVLQIPGTLTGLGILGTFIGLIMGISGIGFSSVEATISSVQMLLSGIEVAFYTSIAGVIFSSLFNILHKITWNIMARQMGMFIEDFHKFVIPSVEEQSRCRERREIQQIIERLDRLPKNPGYSLANSGSSGAAANDNNEQILMPQIMNGLREGEFIFYLQPRYNLTTRKVVGAEALVRWNHSRLGILSPAIFMPVLEKNGYITRLDQYVWEQACATIRRWIDTGHRPIPISLNVSKTDIMAIEIVEFFTDMLKKYRIPPMCLELDVAKNAYLEAHRAAMEAENALRQAGFRVIVDGFDGDYISLNAQDPITADALKLDLRHFLQRKNADALNMVFDQARQLKIPVIAEGIENMEQLTQLRKCGCLEGQGYHFSKPLPLHEFEVLMTGDEPK